MKPERANKAMGPSRPMWPSRPIGEIPARIELLLAAALYLAGLVAYQGLSLAHLRGQLAPDLGDPLLNLSFIEWGGRILEAGAIWRLWSPPFFFPLSGALTYSDHLLGPAFAVWLLGKVGVGAVTAFNLLMLSTFVLAGVSTWWVLRTERASFFAALFGGWIFAFAHMRWDEASHYQVLRAQWIPLVLWSFDRLLVERTQRRLGLFLLFYLLHVSGGAYLAYMVHVPLAAILVVRMISKGRPPMRREDLRLLAAGAVGAVVTSAAFYWGYLARWGARPTTWSAGEVAAQGATWASLWTPSAHSWLASTGWMPQYRTRSAMFIGFVALALVLGELVARRFERTRRSRAVVPWSLALPLALAGLALVGLGWAEADRATLGEAPAGILALLGSSGLGAARISLLIGALLLWLAQRRTGEPVGQPGSGKQDFERVLLIASACALVLTFPVGFSAFKGLLPGLARMRVSYRFFVFVLLGVAWLAARGFDRLRRRVRSRAVGWPLLIALLVVGALEVQPGRWTWQAVPERAEEFPAYARWLAASAKVGAYVEYPLFGDWREAQRMHFQSLHWKPMVNGYSAVIPGSYRRVERLFDLFVDEEGLDRLSWLGVTHIVVHWHERRRSSSSAWRELGAEVDGLVASGAIREVFAGEGTSILEITEREPRQRRRMLQ